MMGAAIVITTWGIGSLWLPLANPEHNMQRPIADYGGNNERILEAPSVMDHLDFLEAEAIFILREVAAECRSPVLLFSGGKDSAVLLHLAWKAYYPERLGCPLLHIDTGHNYPEVIAYRDQMALRYGVALHARSVEDSIQRGTVRLSNPMASRNAHQSVTLMEAIAEFGFDACLGGARRDEEKARAKERVFSIRDEFGQWQPKAQRPELWSLYNTAVAPGEHLRVFPISNWTELDVWRYIQRERIPLPALYFAHLRGVVRRGDVLCPVTAYTPAKPGEVVERLMCRFRTVGDITCTAPVESSAHTLETIIAETAECRITERGATRLDDRAAEAAMETRKKEGYF
jgi:sulfate adenylyltransferase subunit 2